MAEEGDIPKLANIASAFFFTCGSTLTTIFALLFAIQTSPLFIDIIMKHCKAFVNTLLYYYSTNIEYFELFSYMTL